MTKAYNHSDSNFQKNGSTHFSELLKNAVCGFCFSLKKQVFATHHEIAVLRQCSEYLRNDPHRVVHIVAPERHQQSNFIEKTLMHLGVSCGQINLDNSPSLAKTKGECQNDIWLLVADR